MSRPIYTSATTAAVAATGISLSQSLLAAGDLLINGTLVTAGVANFVNPQRVTVTSAGNDAGMTWTVTGTARPEMGGAVQVETFQGANGVATSTQDFVTVTKIHGSAATASTVTAGRSLTGSGPWVVWSEFQTNQQVSYASYVTGSPTWQIDITYDDVFGLWLPASVPFARAVATAITGETGNLSGNLTGTIGPFRASRVTLVAAGSVQTVWTQEGS